VRGGSVENLPRIQNPERVERFLEQLHQVEARVAEGAAEEGFLREADAVFARDRAAEADGEVEACIASSTRVISAAFFSSVRKVGAENKVTDWNGT
jgi:hypothetical protein